MKDRSCTKFNYSCIFLYFAGKRVTINLDKNCWREKPSVVFKVTFIYSNLYTISLMTKILVCAIMHRKKRRTVVRKDSIMAYSLFTRKDRIERIYHIVDSGDMGEVFSSVNSTTITCRHRICI